MHVHLIHTYTIFYTLLSMAYIRNYYKYIRFPEAFQILDVLDIVDYSINNIINDNYNYIIQHHQHEHMNEHMNGARSGDDGRINLFSLWVVWSSPDESTSLSPCRTEKSLWWVDQNRQQQTNDETNKRLADCFCAAPDPPSGFSPTQNPLGSEQRQG